MPGREEPARSWSRVTSQLPPEAMPLPEILTGPGAGVLLDALPALVWVVGPDGLLAWANRRWHAYVAVETTVARAIGWRGIFHDDDHPGMFAAWEASRSSGQPYEVTVRIRRGSDGCYRWFSNSGHASPGPGGTWWIGLCYDIHEAKTAELAARQAEERWQRLAHHMPQMVWTADPAGSVTWANHNWTAYTGQSVMDVSGDGWRRTIHPDDHDRTLAAWSHSLATGEPYAIEHRWRSAADGSYRWFLGRATTVRDAAGRIEQWLGTTTDIHDQRGLRDDLESSQRRLGLALESGGLGMWYSEAPFRGAIANEACKRHYGLSPNDEFDPDGWLEQVHHDDRASAVQAIAESTQTGRPLDVRYRVAGRDGVDRYVRVAARVTLDDEGRPRRLDGVTIDLSAERERAEVFARAADFARLLSECSELLSSSLDYQQTLANLARLVVPRMADWCAIDLADGEGRLKRLAVAHVDPAKVALAHELSRRWPPDPARDPSHRVLRGGAAELVEEVPDELLASLASDDEHLAVIRSLGLRSWMIVPLVARQRRLGVLILVNEARSRSFTRDDLACAEDLARRAGMAIDNASLLAETERARNEAESILLVNRSVAGELDRDRLLQTITDAGVRVTGAQFGAFFYNHMDEKGGKYLLYTLSGAPRSAFDQFPLPRATALFGPTFRGEGVIRSGDIHRDPRYGRNSYGGMPAGHLPVVSYLAVPVRSRGGEVLGGLFFGHGDPDRFSEHHERLAVGIAAQAAIAIDNARLFNAANARTRELARANEELQQFAYVSSHDLQEPLRTVTQYLDLLELRYKDQLDDRAKRFISAAIDSTTRMQSLITDLLEYSRVGKAEMTVASTPLRQVVDDVIRDLHATITTQRADIQVAPLPSVDADATKLRLVLQNLVGNALKFRSDRPPVIAITAAESADSWTISIRDNGIGIAPEHHGRIFDVFQRLHHRDEYAGSGIGLAICKKVVEQHGGRIWLESALGTGTTFHLTLPRAAASATT